MCNPCPGWAGDRRGRVTVAPPLGDKETRHPPLSLQGLSKLTPSSSCQVAHRQPGSSMAFRRRANQNPAPNVSSEKPLLWKQKGLAASPPGPYLSSVLPGSGFCLRRACVASTNDTFQKPGRATGTCSGSPAQRGLSLSGDQRGQRGVHPAGAGGERWHPGGHRVHSPGQRGLDMHF